MSATEDYNSWNPRELVRAAYRAYGIQQPVIDHDPEPNTPAPAPPELVNAEQLALNHAAEQLTCPEGFGDGPHSRHWIPATLTGCVRCGEAAADLIDQANRLETVR